MNLVTLYQTFETFVTAEMLDVFWNNVVYMFEGMPFDEVDEPSPEESWLRFGIHPGDTDRREIRRGGQGIRNGTMVIDIFTPKPFKRIGVVYADQLESVFETGDIGDINPDKPKTNYTGGASSDWLNHVVTVPFWVKS